MLSRGNSRTAGLAQRQRKASVSVKDPTSGTRRHQAKKTPQASSSAAKKRMQATRQRDTTAELSIRRSIHGRGLRYSTHAKPITVSNRRADIVFRRAKVVVFVDGCFWHGCPIHATWPKANADFWREKIDANRKRDSDTNVQLTAAGWLVIRAWEHEVPETVAKQVANAVRRRTQRGRALHDTELRSETGNNG
jgi:DNA mismatch endonuclease Vsr